jgi:hypothetical protein
MAEARVFVESLEPNLYRYMLYLIKDNASHTLQCCLLMMWAAVEGLALCLQASQQ